MSNSIKLAKLFCDPDYIQRRISSEVVPLALHVTEGREGESGEMVEALETAAETTRNYLQKYELTAERRSK